MRRCTGWSGRHRVRRALTGSGFRVRKGACRARAASAASVGDPGLALALSVTSGGGIGSPGPSARVAAETPSTRSVRTRFQCTHARAVASSRENKVEIDAPNMAGGARSRRPHEVTRLCHLGRARALDPIEVVPDRAVAIKLTAQPVEVEAAVGDWNRGLVSDDARVPIARLAAPVGTGRVNADARRGDAAALDALSRKPERLAGDEHDPEPPRSPLGARKLEPHHVRVPAEADPRREDLKRAQFTAAPRRNRRICPDDRGRTTRRPEPDRLKPVKAPEARWSRAVSTNGWRVVRVV